ncbi:MAG: flagellar protein FliT [Rhodothermales bacterium]
MTYTLHQMLALGRRILEALEEDELDRFFLLFDQRGQLIESLTEQHTTGSLSTPACKALLTKLERQEEAISAALSNRESLMETQIQALQHQKKAQRSYTSGPIPPPRLNPRLTG